ncbi:hypothetical protein NKH47_12235 [Mesorhizobium sp. M1060]|uniref:hypothetical protein n=1 Tax=Mesorhizobium sp. M1060 TaxID=2957052 RepID=UPI00333DC62D
MDIEAHRRQYLAEVESALAGAAKPVTPAAVADYAALDDRDAQTMCDMIMALPLDSQSYEISIRTLLDIVGNRAIDTTSRLAAIRQLGAAEFKPVEFAPFHAEFIDLLRRLSIDSNKDIRTAALERLTLTNDAEAQRLLREGLENVRKPLVPAAKAIQLLARDDHGSAIPLFRTLAVTATGQVREQALRALATDTKSVALFESIAANKQEKTPLRQIAAVNLKNTSTPRFAKFARKLVLDDEDDDQLRAATVSAITHASHVAAKLTSAAFTSAVISVGATTASRALKSSINRFSKTLGTKQV